MYIHYLWTFFEIAGTVAFAISGALVGISRKMDIFGLLVLALCTAIGGGVIRDILVGNVPPNSFQTSLYIVLTVVVTLMVFFVYRQSRLRYRSTRRFRRYYILADTLGLASFTVTGASVGMNTFPQFPVLVVVLGLITAVGGGMLRDILAQRIPPVLREEVYALPAIIGSMLYYFMASAAYWYIASYVAFVVVFVLRMLAIKQQWSLPRVR